MGEVWRARDQKLGREVAIKTLPEEFAKDEERLARFEREAKLLASLNHPNIAAIYGLEEDNGTRFLVLELVEGDTLTERLKRGAIPVEESLKLALQVAEALEAAHEKGVIHRDLKPANIKVTPEGKIKVLDFGLAKAFAGDGSDVNLSQSPTLSMAATQQAVILGTAAYMSPEQARGVTVDKRADIWAFGCVLYEMLTGRQTWGGETVTDMIAAAVAREPDWQNLPGGLAPRIHETLSRCLEKDPRRRFRDIGDVLIDIESAQADPDGSSGESLVVPEAPKSTRVVWAATLGAVVGIILTLVIGWTVSPPLADESIVRFPVILPAAERLVREPFRMVDLSQDGTRIVYKAAGQLYLRNLDQLDLSVPIRGTENSSSPFFSPDGQWIGFWQLGLKKVSVNGGPVIAICEAESFSDASWGEDDLILFGQEEGIMQVRGAGGTPRLLIEVEAGERADGPQRLPGKAAVLFTLSPAVGNASMVVESLESGDRHILGPGTNARYVPSSHLVFDSGGVLMAAPFNIKRLELIDSPVPVLENIQTTLGVVQLSFAGNGSMVYIPGSSGERSLVWVDRQGVARTLGFESKSFAHPRISPNGTRLAVEVADNTGRNIWVYGLERQTEDRLTFDPASDTYPVWTTDSEHLMFASDRAGGRGLHRKAADGTGQTERLSGSGTGWPQSLSPDGKTLVFSTLDDIGTLDLENDTSTMLLDASFAERWPEVSPDGRWVAYSSDESGTFQVYVRPFPRVDEGQWQVSEERGNWPFWAPDGTELFYFNPRTASMMRVAVEAGSSPNAGPPEALFSGVYIQGGGRHFDITPDGQRFLMLRDASVDESTTSQFNIVLNWFEDLKERVPVP